MKVIIEITVAPEFADSGDDTGVTEDGFNEIHDGLMGIAEDIKIRKG